jgi:hypothetical protein
VAWKLALYTSLDKKNPENSEIESQVQKMVSEADDNKAKYMARLQAVRDAIKRSREQSELPEESKTLPADNR